MKKQVLLITGVFLGSFILLSMTSLISNEQEKWEVPSKYQKMVNPYAGVSDTDKIGRILYAKHCKSCHGSKGKGDGTKAKSLDTTVGDFTDASFKSQKDGSLYYKSFIGRDEMPSFIKKIPDEEEQWLVINYIKGL